ncbi:MAG: efflux RND transporter periplasmic adaptor subunit [Patescibacteria group bacterium]|nr:efflux RND transporter periplasmic adaptor subunit [Patescibacteria group bacterium]
MKNILSILRHTILAGKRRYVVIGLVLLLVLGVVLKPFGLFGGSSATQYKTESVLKSDLTNQISVSGQVESNNLATMAFLATGRVASINFQEGDTVKKGQVIASLDTTQAQDSVAKAEANVKSAQSYLDKVIDDIHLFQYGNGGFSNVGTANETETQKMTRQQAEAARDAAARDLDSARQQLQMMTIIAPFDGTISDISGISPGQNYAPTTGGTISEVGSGGYKFVANVDETDFRNISLGMSADVLLDAYPNDKFPAEVSKIAVSASKLSTGGSIVPVELSIEPNEKLLNGLTGEADFNLVGAKSVLNISRIGLRKENGQEYVYVLEKGKAVRKNVQSGQSMGGRVEIVQGLSENEQVILNDTVQ